MLKSETGRLGEAFAVKQLRKKGFQIKETNFRSRFGEIDIIAENGVYISFVEVKTRGGNALARPAEFVDAGKRRRLIRTATLYLEDFPTALQPRFDVFEVIMRGDKVLNFYYIENAFDIEGYHADF